MKREFIGELRAENQELLALIDGIEEATLTMVPVCGTWTAKEVLSHLAAVRIAALNAFRQEHAGEPVTWAWSAYPDGDAWNLAEVEHRRNRSTVEIRAELEATQRDILDLLESLPDTWKEEDSQASWLASHEREHTQAFQELRAT
ncbi:MAG: maleylpyruvate isomerase N-terminal domain-containing protein [Chloroflexota bacterium]